MTTKLSLPIIAAMLAIGASTPSAQTGAPPPSGIFLIGADGAATPVPGEMSQDLQTSGIGKSILTQGISKPTQTVRYPGATSGFAVTEAQPVFLFRFVDQAKMAQMAQQDPMAYLSSMQGAGGGAPLMGKDAKEYVLIKVPVDGDTRVPSSKGRETVKLVIQKKSALEFEVRVAQPLEPGEYAFCWNAAGAAPTQIWGFSVKK